jgi:ribosomal protein S2
MNEGKKLATKDPRVAQKSTQTRSLAKKAELEVGRMCILTIRAIGPQNLGVVTRIDGSRIFVPGVQLGDVIQAQITHTQFGGKQKMALAKVIQKFKTGANRKNPGINVGDIFTATIDKSGPCGSGLARLNGQYPVVIPNAPMPGTVIQIQVTRMKSKYAFAKLVNGPVKVPSSVLQMANAAGNTGLLGREGTRLTIRLPRNAKRYGKRVVVTLQPSGQVVFIRLQNRARLGDLVRVQLERVYPKFSLGSVVSVSPTSQTTKVTRMRQSVRAMVQTGMHWGEKAVRCDARMRKYVWLQRSASLANATTIGRPLIKKGRHVLNLLRTRRCLLRALHQVGQYAMKGHPFLFVGTKKSAAGLVARAAFLTNTSFYVNTRWLGGMLTNWQTILKSIAKIQPILAEKQQLVNRVLKKRRMIKQLLLQRVHVYKTQTQVLRRLVQQANQLLQRMRQTDKAPYKATQVAWKAGQAILRRIQPLAETRRDLRQTQAECMTRLPLLQAQARQLRRTYLQVANQVVNQANVLKHFSGVLRLSQVLDRMMVQSPSAKALVLQNAAFAEENEALQKGRLVPPPPKYLAQKAVQWTRQANIPTTTEASAETQAKAAQVYVLNPVLQALHALGPYAENSVKTAKEQLTVLEEHGQVLQQNLKVVNEQLEQTQSHLQLVNLALGPVESALVAESVRLKPWKMGYRRWTAEKRFWEFLPKFKQVSTGQAQMRDAAQTVMRRLVDPKLKEQVALYDVYAEKLKTNSKKVAAARKKQWQRLETYLGGVTRMTKLKAGQITQLVAVIVGQSNEMNAVRECQKLGIPTVQLIDTDGNPMLANHVVPMNDDSRQALKYVLNQMIARIRLAHKLRTAITRARKPRFANDSRSTTNAKYSKPVRGTTRTLKK